MFSKFNLICPIKKEIYVFENFNLNKNNNNK